MLGRRRIAGTLVFAAALCSWIATPGTAQDDAESAMWEIIKDSGDSTLFLRFLESYPNGEHAGDANARLREMDGSVERLPSALSAPYESEAAILWDDFKTYNLPEPAEQFLEQYPEASDAASARLNLELLRNPPPPPLLKPSEGWTTIENPRFGFTVDIPPGFQYREGDLTLEHLDYRGGGTRPEPLEDASILIRSFYVLSGNFEQEITAWVEDLRGLEDVTGLALTPTTAQWSWEVDGSIYQFAAIALCDGETYASVSLQYFPAGGHIHEQTIKRLRNSLRATGGGEDCI